METAETAPREILAGVATQAVPIDEALHGGVVMETWWLGIGISIFFGYFRNILIGIVFNF